MQTYKQNFIKFMVDCGVLTFGDFTLKSGRKSPYFMNAGNYNTGFTLAKLGEYYADCIQDNLGDFDVLLGPAYKGIPLCVTAAAALSTKYDKNVAYCFDRKETKDHGEGGLFVGKQPKDGDKIVIIDDVMTSGKALGEILPKIRAAAEVEIVGVVITVDRMEKALNSELSAVGQVYEEHGIKVYSIVNICDVIEAIETGVIEGKEYLSAIKGYLEEYGVK
jgi:orotate phosphoribosyltransferase